MNTKIFEMKFSLIYDLLAKKLERKNHTKEELNKIIEWLTGYNENEIFQMINSDIDYKTFFDKAPQINDKYLLIKGSICGYKLSEIEDDLVRKIRVLDKLVDDLYKGKTLDKILI